MNIPLKQYWALLAGYLAPQRGRVILLALLLLANIGLELLNPQIVRYFIDTAQAGGALAALLSAAFLFIGVALVTQVLSVWATYLGENVAWTATNALRIDVAAHCLRLDLSFHKARTPGELIERIDGDVTALSSFFSQLVLHVLANLVLLGGVLVLLFGVDWRVGLALTAFTILALVILVRIRAVAAPSWLALRQVNALFFGFLGEHVAGTEDTRANGATGYVMQRFYTLLRNWWPLQRKAGLAGYAMWITTVGVFSVGTAVAFGLGAYLWSLGAVTLGTVYLIFYYTQLLNRPIEQIRTQLQELQRAGASVERVQELLRTPSRLVDGPGAPLPAGPLAVALAGVTFGYEAEESVLRNLTFDLPAGTILGLLGRTGSGKTTLARLLLRLYDPQAGTIRLGGVPIRDAYLRELRRRVGMVTQDVQLFAATVRDNLTFFDDTIPDSRILAVLHDLDLRRWYDTLPQGLDTLLEAGGGGLSAGEAQLLAFVRIFLADPGLVILDEASSRLDPATEALIERAVSKLLVDRTGIIIAHRLATIGRADRVLILEDGQILEHGDRRQLARDPASRFYQLLRSGIQEALA
ncbi:MAG TPA: ABC transporter ATP-binding protein [Chloroflexia bacterium]|nr:ABC transporter ATP-binding protein [Chloroflexia bacterium]